MAEKKKSNDGRDEHNPEYDNFQRLLEGTLAVSKEELDKRRDEYERAKARARRKREDG